MGFIGQLVNSWHQKQQECFGGLVAALMKGGRLGVAAIGRHRRSKTSEKHDIKAVDRFLGNRKIQLLELWAGLIAQAVTRQNRLLVLLDWTDLHDGRHEVLVAAVSFGGRALPIAWTTSEKSQYTRSRNSIEVSLCTVLKTLLPAGVELVIVADRGFGRASFFKALRRRKIRFIIRIRRDVHIIDQRGHGAVHHRRVRRGQTRDLINCQYSDNQRIEVRCVITFGEGQGRNRPQTPWYLVTDFSDEELSAHAIVAGYKLRMRIEHSFRDHKSLRFGFQLRSVSLSHRDRYDRLLAIAAAALLLLVLVGLSAERRGLARTFRANTAAVRTHSLLFLGLAFLSRLHTRPSSLMLCRAFDRPFAGIG